MKSRKFRRKVTDDADQGDDDHAPIIKPPASLANKQQREKDKEKKRSAAGKILLSFGDDEEAHGPVLERKTGKLKASGVQTSATTLAGLKTTTTQISGPGVQSSPRATSTILLTDYGPDGPHVDVILITLHFTQVSTVQSASRSYRKTPCSCQLPRSLISQHLTPSSSSLAASSLQQPHRTIVSRPLHMW